MINPANRESSGAAEPGRRALLALMGIAFGTAASHRFPSFVYACGPVSERTRHNDDSARIIVEERRAILDQPGNPTRYEPAFGNHHIILAPTRAQLDNFRRLFTGGQIEDMTVNDLLALGIRSALLQTKEDERVPGYGRMWTNIYAGLDSEQRRKWRWGVDYASVVGYPEFTKKLEGCEGDFPAHLIFLAKVEQNDKWGVRLELYREELVAVNCSPLVLLETSRVEPPKATPTTEVTTQPPATPAIESTPSPAAPIPQLPPPGRGAPQIPKPKSEIIVDPTSLLAQGNPWERLAV